MRRTLFSVLVVALSVGCGGEDFSTGDDGGAGGSAPAAGSCEQVCSTRAELACAGETAAKCESECAYYEKLVSWCEGPADETLGCLSAEPSASFACEDTKQALRIRPGICETELTELLDCWYEGPAGGLPAEVAQACHTMCSTIAALPCAPPTCVDDCLAELDPTKSCDGISGAWIACAATQPAASWKCAGVPDKPELESAACAEYALLRLGCLAG